MLFRTSLIFQSTTVITWVEHFAKPNFGLPHKYQVCLGKQSNLFCRSISVKEQLFLAIFLGKPNILDYNCRLLEWSTLQSPTLFSLTNIWFVWGKQSSLFYRSISVTEQLFAFQARFRLQLQTTWVVHSAKPNFGLPKKFGYFGANTLAYFAGALVKKNSYF